jgi:hypothetical protein
MKRLLQILDMYSPGRTKYLPYIFAFYSLPRLLYIPDKIL